MKLLGVDYGRRRIGIAATDECGIAIRGVTVIDRRAVPHWRAGLLDVIRREAPELLVVGIPLDHHDRETPMSAEARAFGNELAASAALPVRFVDESFSSRRAQEILSRRRRKDRRDKRNADRIAACLILQAYLSEQPLQGPSSVQS